MTNKYQKKQDHNKNIGSVVAGVAGAVAVAGVAVAATMALRDEKTREKAKKVLTNVKDQAIDYVDTLKTEPNKREKSSSIKKLQVKK